MGIQTDFIRLTESLGLGPVLNVENSVSTPTLEIKLTMSFVGIPLVILNGSLTRKTRSLEKMMGPFGDLMERVIRFGSGQDDY